MSQTAEEYNTSYLVVSGEASASVIRNGVVVEDDVEEESK